MAPSPCHSSSCHGIHPYDIQVILTHQWWYLSIAEEHEDNLFGDINMVNGVPWPVMSVKAKYHRFRVGAVAGSNNGLCCRQLALVQEVL
jgi:hypothetical protein